MSTYRVSFFCGSDVSDKLAKGAPGVVDMERVPEWGEVVEVRGGPNGGCYLYVDEVVNILSFNSVAGEALGFPAEYEVRLVRENPREKPLTVTVS